RHAVIDDLVAKHVPENAYPEQWDTAGLKEELKRVLGLDLPVDEWAKEEGIADEELLSRIERQADEHMAKKVAQWGPDVIRYVEKSILLQSLDQLWRQHLLMLEHLRQVIGLRGYGQRDPLNEYKSESFHLFEAMIQQLREAVTAQLMRVEVVTKPSDRGPEDGASPPQGPGPPASFHGSPQDRPDHWGGRDGVRQLALCDRRCRGRRAHEGAQAERSVDLGQGRTQRAVPLRFGQEIQALPRALRLTSTSA